MVQNAGRRSLEVRGRANDAASGEADLDWRDESTYVRRPPFFDA